jgi:hypothetical protein
MRALPALAAAAVLIAAEPAAAIRTMLEDLARELREARGSNGTIAAAGRLAPGHDNSVEARIREIGQLLRSDGRPRCRSCLHRCSW